MCKPCSSLPKDSETNHKVKCQFCKKVIAKSINPIKCIQCSGLFHKKCSIGKSGQSFLCKPCSFNALPLCDLNDEKFHSTLNALDNIVSENLNLLPSFSIKSKLDKFPKYISFQTGENLSKNITSKYLTPMEFTKMKKDTGNLSFLHINIVSIQKNIDELRQLLSLLNYEFDIIGLSETRLNEDPFFNIDIEYYRLASIAFSTG